MIHYNNLNLSGRYILLTSFLPPNVHTRFQRMIMGQWVDNGTCMQCAYIAMPVIFMWGCYFYFSVQNAGKQAFATYSATYIIVCTFLQINEHKMWNKFQFEVCHASMQWWVQACNYSYSCLHLRTLLTKTHSTACGRFMYLVCKIVHYHCIRLTTFADCFK